MTELLVGVKTIGIAAEGLPNWTDSVPVLRGNAPYVQEELPRYAPNLLPPNERRRATQVGRLAFQSAEEAIGGVNGEASQLASVFASSGGDSDIVCNICSALSTEARLVSPTHFHNSVHNATAGYWSIATGSHGASTSLSAFDGTFGMGLLEAATLASCEGQDVLLVSYDGPMASPLDSKRNVNRPFTCAMTLSTELDASDYELKIAVVPEGVETAIEEPGLESLRKNNPAARALPLLRLLAIGGTGEVILPAMDDMLVRVTVTCRI